MPLVAMTREMGSLGKDVAQGVAKQLGIPIISHEIIDTLANKMRLRKSHVVRFLEGKANMIERLTTDKTSLSIYTAEETFQLALRGKGAVIRGWGATHLLRPISHVVCVRVCAPVDLRKKRMMDRLNTDDERFVENEIKISDEAHGAVMRRHFSVDWHDPELYDVVLNTERVSIDECVEEVMNLVRHPDFRETDESRVKLDNLALAAKVRAALRLHPDTSKVQIAIDADSGAVTLAGIVDNDEQRANAERIAAGVPGVKNVRNHARVIADANYKLDG